MKVWVSRDYNTIDPVVELCTKKPELVGHCYFGRPLTFFCYKEFKRITGFKLKPGECKRVEIKVKEVK